MLYVMDCKARINAQDPDYPTYKALDCIAHINANEIYNWYGRIMDCTATITSLIVTACKNWDQGIRLKVEINTINVSNALIDSLSIRHDKNTVSDFSLFLGDTIYSPRINSNIDLDKEVIITAYINGQEKKLFTGTLDEPSAENTPDFKVSITGRDYGKKLLDKKTTIVSVQGLADSTLRNDVIKYLAEQASVTAVDIPEMDAVTIDNSFTYQTIWDMIQKEIMVELYWIKFDEDGNLKLLLDEIKSDTTLYPTPDWTYDESRIIRLGYKKGRLEMNKIIVLGKTTTSRIPVKTEAEPGQEEAISNYELITYKKSWVEDSEPLGLNGTETQENFNFEISLGGYDSYKYSYWFIVTWGGEYIITERNISGDNITTYENYFSMSKIKCVFNIPRMSVNVNKLQAGSISISIRGRKRKLVPDEGEDETIYETRYDQISAEVTDPNSIAKYGERDGGSVDYPLLETVEQCTAVGSKAIRDSHRLLGQTDLRIPFNPLIETGQTIAITENKIGIIERYYIEKIEHNINFGDGKIDAETIVGGVLYA